MADGGLLLFAALALAAQRKKSAPKPPDPPKVPDAPPGGQGGGDKTAETIGSLAGTGAGVLATFLGGGSGAGGTGLTGGAVGVGGVGGGTVTATTASSGVAIASTTVVTAGGVFCLAWAALYVLQFIVIDALKQQRQAWLAYRQRFYNMNMPFLWLQSFEQLLAEEALKQLGLRSTWREVGSRDEGGTETYPGSGVYNDPRLTTPGYPSNELANAQRARVQYDNPFLGYSASAYLASESWRHLQMGARLVASRYVFELGKFARGMLARFPGLGGNGVEAQWANDALEVWNYPLLGGGQPDKSYAAYHQEVLGIQAAAPAGAFPYSIDDVLNAARLTACLNVASNVKSDPEVRFGGSANGYASALFTALDLGNPNRNMHMTLGSGSYGYHIPIDPAFYKVPVRSLWLDVHLLKGGMPCQPFQPGYPGLVFTPQQYTALAALP